MRKRNLSSSVVAVCAFFTVCSAGEMIQPQRIIHCHTAGILPRGTYTLDFSVYPNGSLDMPGSGMLVGIDFGLLNRFNIGVSYGGDGVIGRDAPVFNPHAGVMVKYRLFEETYLLPAFAVGYDHQGCGGIDKEYNGYIFKSPGFFLAVSKNYLVLTKVQFGIHGGINYSFEESRTVKWPSGYVGADLGINEELSVAAEYDLALNERDPGSGAVHYDNPLRGFLNLGIRWSFSRSLYLEFDINDILTNKVTAVPLADRTVSYRALGWSREMKLDYIQQF
jgi:hypothetical protein